MSRDAGDERLTEAEEQEIRARLQARKIQATERAAERLRRRTILAFGLLKLGQAASSFAGTSLGRLSRKEPVGVVGGIE
jgi:hypothetical protein